MKISSTKICEQNNINGITVHASQERYTGNIVGSAKFPTVKNSQIYICQLHFHLPIFLAMRFDWVLDIFLIAAS